MKSSRIDRRERLRQALETAPAEHLACLCQLKEKGRSLRNRDGALWFLILQSFSTMGNSNGWKGLFGPDGHASMLDYEQFIEVSTEQRAAYASSVFAKAKVRMPSKKGGWLAKAVERVRALGGPAAAWRAALALHTRSEKLDFLLAFDGIGEKYARNIWMDVYDHHFRDAVAIDERIKRVTGALSLTFSTYSAHEKFYQELARDAGREPWEVDRLLYRFRDYYLSAISEVPAGSTEANGCR